MDKRKALIYGAFTIFGLGLYLGLTMKSICPTKNPDSWEILIFSQSWPQTSCYTWLTKNHKHSCEFSSQKHLWAIQGLWPTKIGLLGPSICNRFMSYDLKFIDSIQYKLNEHWTNIEVLNITKVNILSNTTSHKKENVWCEDSEKHGTCDLNLPALNSELKYFNQGIEWSEKYNMKLILEKGGITVNNTTLLVADYWKALKSVLKTNAWIECVPFSDTKQQMISEIKICFDKSLKVIDCNSTMFKKGTKISDNELLTNCDLEKTILYLNNIPKQNSFSNAKSITNDENSEIQSRVKRTEPELTFFNRTTHLWLKNMRAQSRKRHDFDYVIFSQYWPYNFHLHQNDENPVIDERKQWIVQGIWPKKIGTEGPTFCNIKAKFNIHRLKPFLKELRFRWYELRGPFYHKHKLQGQSLWKHEWLKFGSCFLYMQQLDTEYKYFRRALIWNKKFGMTNILKKGNITVNGVYKLRQFWNAIEGHLGKSPRILCYYNTMNKRTYISEIQVCLTKGLGLIDCTETKNLKTNVNTNCPLGIGLHYVVGTI